MMGPLTESKCKLLVFIITMIDLATGWFTVKGIDIVYSAKAITSDGLSYV